MPVTRGFLELVTDALAALGPIGVRRMFGGAGLYADGVMFALVEDDVLYFKADARSAERYTAEGMIPFAFEGQTRMVETSYWRVPDRLYDDSDDMLMYAREAVQIAHQINADKTKRRRQSRARTARR